MLNKENITSPLTPSVILLMTIATGLAVASNYYAQPLLATIADQFKVTTGKAGLIVTVAQLSYAAGLLFIVPLGDILEQKKLIVSMMFCSAIGLLITALSPSLMGILIGTAITGVFSVVAQVLVPMSAALANPQERGKIVGTLMAGLMIGILLARTFAGFLTLFGTWRAIFWAAFAVTLLVTFLLWRKLPTNHNESTLKYPHLIGSIFTLFFQYKRLRMRALLGGLSFANFSILWTSITFLLAGRPYHYSDFIIGLFGLVGVAGAVMSNRSGKLADHGYAKPLLISGFILLTFSWIPIWYGQHNLLLLIIGIFILDLAIPMVHITNQTMIYRILPEARGRLTAGYITAYFIGGALGSLISAYAYHQYSWHGVVTVGIVMALLGLGYALINHKNLD